MSGLLKDKRGVILGVANRRSLAWGIADRFYQEGARFTVVYQNEKFSKSVKALMSPLKGCSSHTCDVSSDAEIDELFIKLEKEFGQIDFLVHSIAYAPPRELKGHFYEVSREGFLQTLDISAFSLTRLSQKAQDLMKNGGSIITMTSLGGWHILPRYHVMGVAKAALESSLRYLAADLGVQGVRVNGISAGPIPTLSAKGIRSFSKIMQVHKARSPLRRNAKLSDVASTALYLASDLSENITGEIIFVDSGYHVIGI